MLSRFSIISTGKRKIKNKHYNCTLQAAQAALQGYSLCQYHISEFIDDDDEDDESNGVFVDDNQELFRFDGSGGKVTDEAWRKIVAGRSQPSGRLGILRGRWALFQPEPLKTISRERYEEDQAHAFRFDTAAYVQHRLSQGLARIARAFGIPREAQALTKISDAIVDDHLSDLISRFHAARSFTGLRGASLMIGGCREPDRPYRCVAESETRAGRGQNFHCI
jgi:hypothetical protein